MVTYSCLHFRELNLEQLYDILKLRQEVFVVEQNCPYLDADGLDPQCFHLMGRDGKGRLAAYVRLVPEGIVYPGYAAFGRVATSSLYRGKGHGRALMDQTMIWMARLFPNVPVKISAQKYLTRFYESYGFRIYGEEYLEDGIPHVAMVYDRRGLGVGGGGF
jgi:ElaA protein